MYEFNQSHILPLNASFEMFIEKIPEKFCKMMSNWSYAMIIWCSRNWLFTNNGIPPLPCLQEKHAHLLSQTSFTLDTLHVHYVILGAIMFC